MAGRISGFAGNLLVTAAVLLMALVVGRQLTESWRGATSPAAVPAPGTGANSPAELAPAGQPALLEFGAARLSIRRATVAGDRAAALAELRRMCRAPLARPELPARPTDAAERELLDLVSGQSPAEKVASAGELFESPGALTMVVGTVGTAKNAGPAAPNVGATPRRVVTWGVAVPTGKGTWTAYSFEPRAAADPSATAGPGHGTMRVPLPPGARHLLSVRETGAACVTAFRGLAAVDDWTRFYDEWFATAGYHSPEGWNRSEGACRARFEPRGGGAGEQVDIYLGDDGQRGLRGLLISSRDNHTASETP